MPKDSQHPPPLPDSSSWYLDETSLLSELRRARLSLDSTPAITGYAGLRELQRGGQGIVYAATQTSTRRTVAVKVLHPTATDSASARRRFEREIELAATLRHEGVVRVYDSGSTSDGRLFLSMELVEGETLDKAAAALHRDPKRIAELFARVCDALNHAHQRGVLHRDLKPSNIRVDSSGHPRILDFGLARPVESSPDVTATGSFLGSLPWASPEQAKGLQDQIDIRSDIYSLGVILFQLLTGRFPYEVSGPLRSTLDIIASTEPLPLRKARPGVHEDLEVIAAKCLAKDPSHRYQTAADLAEDLRLFAAGQPIRARRESAWNAMARRLRRYRVLSWTAAGVLVVLAGATVAIALLARTAAQDRDKAQLATRRAESTLRFFTGMLEAADPDAAGGGRDVRVATLLDQAAAKIDTDFADDPATLATLHNVIGQTYSSLGLEDAAMSHFRLALAAANSAPELGPDDPGTMEIEANVADMYLHQAKGPEAEAILRPLVPRMLAHLPPDSPNVLMARSDLGLALRRQDKLDDAEAEDRAALSTIPTDSPPSDIKLGLINNLASVLQTKGKFDEAMAFYQEALKGRITLNGPDHSETITIRSNIAKLDMDRGRFDEAEKTLRAAMDSSVRLRGPDHPVTLTVEHNLAYAIENNGHKDEALNMWRDVVERRERVLGPTHAFTLASMNNLASLLDAEGFTDEAEQMDRAVLDRRMRTLSEKSLDTIVSINNLGQQLLRHDRARDAEPFFRRAVALSAPDQGVLPEGHWVHAVFQSNLANCLDKEGRSDEALPLITQAVATLVAKVGPDHPNTKKARATLERIQHETPPKP